MSPSTLLIDQSIPLSLFQAVTAIQGNVSGSLTNSPSERQWLSNGHKMSDPSWEVLTIRFKSAASISLISFEMLSVGCTFEVWYTNRSGVRLPVLDQSLRQFKGSVSSNQLSDHWINWTRNIYPVVASSIEIRMQRVDDGVYDSEASVSLGLRNTYFKRNIYGREDTILALDSGVDSMGNSIQRTVKDWDALKAVDSNLNTFWKCEPQPDPNAVVCFYIDCKSANESAQRVDRLWLDPVYTGQSMNLYYSSDEAVGTRKLSKIRLPSLDSSINWLFDEGGLNLKSPSSTYDINSIALGQFNLSDPGATFLGTWVPDFDSSNSPGANLYLLRNESQGVSTDNIQLVFNVGSKRITFLSGGVTVSSASLSFQRGSRITFAATTGIRNWLTIYQSGAVSSKTTNNSTTTHSSKWGTKLQLQYNNGWIKDLAIKQGSDDTLINSYFANPSVFLTPDPVISDSSGVVPSTTLDNVVYGADFTQGQHGFGGLDHNFFTEKNWTPMFKDWSTYRGFYYFPEPITTKFIKLEFTQLVAESYPVYETGIDVTYQSFPISVINTSKSLLNESRNTTLTTTNVTSSLRGNVSSSSSVSSSYDKATVTYKPDTEVTIGNAVFDDIPRSFDTPVSTSFQKEVTSSSFSSNSTKNSSQTNYVTTVDYIQKQVTSTSQIARDVYYTVVKGDWLIKIADKYNIDWRTIYNLNKNLVDSDPRVSRLPSRPAGWWIFPGQQLRIPGVVMENVTQTSTVTERVVSTTADIINTSTNLNSNTQNTSTLTTARARFTTTQVHRYEYKTAKRDAAIAYFTGLREVQLFSVNYIAAEDTPSYELYGSDFVNLTDISTNFQIQNDNSWKANSPSSIATVTNSGTWNSTSPFVKMKLQLYGNFIYREVSGISNLIPIDLNSAGVNSFWSDSNAMWNDSVATWGSTGALGSASFSNGVFYEGEAAMRIVRDATPTTTEIGVKTPLFKFPQSLGLTSITVVYNSNINRLSSTNTYKLEVIDPTNEANPLFSEIVGAGPPGKWNTYTTHFFYPPDARDVYVRFMTSGTEREELYIGNLYTKTTSTRFEISNDNGVTYYDATSVVNDSDSSFVFPKLGNKLKWKISCYGPREHFYGLKLIPYYLI